MVWCDIYEYSEARRLFRKHRAGFIWKCDASKVQISDKVNLSLVSASEDEFKAQLPAIIKVIFEQYEEHLNEKLRAQEAEDWDGVVKM